MIARSCEGGHTSFHDIRRCSVTIPLLMFFSGCLGAPSDPDWPRVPAGWAPVPFEEISLSRLDCVSSGGSLSAVVTNQAEYDSLIYTGYTRRIEEYWERNHDRSLENIRRLYPGLSEEEYEARVRAIIEGVLPGRCAELDSFPEIDFSKYSLLGKDTHGGGCSIAGYDIEFYENRVGQEYVLRVRVRQRGNCSMFIGKQTWILVPRQLAGSTVRFDVRNTHE